MTKAEFTSYVIRRLGGIKQNIKFHPAFVEAAIERGFNQIIYETFRKDLSFLSFFAKEYKNVPVSLDTDTNIQYSNLPAPIIQLPDYASGVRRISSISDTTASFYPVSEECMELLGDSEAFEIMGDIPYVVRQDRVEYASWFSPDAAGVKMSLVIPYRSYDDSDQVHIPSGQDERLMEVIVNFLIGTPDQDLKNDNANG